MVRAVIAAVIRALITDLLGNLGNVCTQEFDVVGGLGRSFTEIYYSCIFTIWNTADGFILTY